MKAIKYLIFSWSVILFAGCSAADADDIEVPGEIQKPAEEEVEQREYDERFPFAVWTDEDGRPHFDIDLNDGSEAFPAADALMANIVGRGWVANLTYIYHWRNSEYSGKLIQNEYVENTGYNIVGGDINRKIFFKDNTTATVFYNWSEFFASGIVGPIYASSEDKAYTYNAQTGVLDGDVLKRYKVVFSDKDNLWLMDKSEKELEGSCAVLHLKSVPDATVAEWQNTYTDPHRVN